MFFDDVSRVREISEKAGTSIFVMPGSLVVDIPGAIILEPEEKTVISVEQVRNMLLSFNMRQVDDFFVIIRPADKLGLDAANTLLKNLEEPGDKMHFVLITSNITKILPTIRSRAAIYFWRGGVVDTVIEASNDDKSLAKRLMVASGRELVMIAETVAKKKPPREYALNIIGLTIEMLYKSYFITKKDVFLLKLPKFLAVYDKISKNGHIKLQIIAGLC